MRLHQEVTWKFNRYPVQVWRGKTLRIHVECHKIDLHKIPKNKYFSYILASILRNTNKICYKSLRSFFFPFHLENESFFKDKIKRKQTIIRYLWKIIYRKIHRSRRVFQGERSSQEGNEVKRRPLGWARIQCECCHYWALRVALVGKIPPAGGFDPWVGKIPWRRAWQPTPVFLPGESQGLRSLVGYSPQSPQESDTTEVT